MSFREMSFELSGCHYNTAKKALDELIDGGLVIPTTCHPKYMRLASEYRLSFISYGPENAVRPASNDYKTLLPQVAKQKQNSVDKSSTEQPKPVEPVSAERKQPGDDGSTGFEETPMVSVEPIVEPLSAHIVNHGIGLDKSVSNAGKLEREPGESNHDPFMQLDELWDFCRQYIDWAKCGGQSRLAEASHIPKGTLSKFLSGRGLSDLHRINLHIAVHAAFPIKDRPMHEKQAA